MVSISSLFRFVFIFSVLTVAGVGFLFDEMAFIWLAVLNAVVLGFVWLIVRFTKSSPAVSHAPKHKKESDEEIIEEKEIVEDEPVQSKSSHHAHHQQFVKYTYNHKKKKKSVIVWLIVALVAASALYLMIKESGSSDQKIVDDSLTGYAEDILSQKDMLSGTAYSGTVVESTGQVLSTGSIVQANTWVAVDKSFVTSGESTPTTTPVSTPKPILSSSTLKFTSTQSLSLLESVVYLLQTHKTPLNLKKDVKFPAISTTNPYYKYWYTAYKLGLIGQTSSPTSLVSCQTYFVLKGLLEKWDLVYTPTNVKTVFFAEAQKRDLLNGCVFGKILKWGNL